MKKTVKDSNRLALVHNWKKMSGQQWLDAYKALPKVSSIQMPQGFDDQNDTSSLLLSLTDDERLALNFPLPEKKEAILVLPPIATQAKYKVRVHAILCANDNGTGGAASPNAVDANYLLQLIAATNLIYQNTDIQFVYDPATDFERIKSTLLNQDFIPPTNLNYNLPETTPPLTRAQIDILAKPHNEERQRVGLAHRHEMVLLFCNGNELVYDKSAAKWKNQSPRGFAFSGYDLEFVALPTGKDDPSLFALLVAHEVGHYFHLAHTHYLSPKTVPEAIENIRVSVENNTFSEAEGLNVFDGDKIQDTPPDAGPDLFNNVYHSDGCGPQDTITIPVKFKNGHMRTYLLKPDRSNAMSYFRHCPGATRHFSPLQIDAMQRSMDVGQNRWHLRFTANQIVLCNQTKTEITKLEIQIKGLQNQLRNTAGAGKAALVHLIKTAQEKIKKLNRYLGSNNCP